jgi:hypothetical protein
MGSSEVSHPRKSIAINPVTIPRTSDGINFLLGELDIIYILKNWFS